MVRKVVLGVRRVEVWVRSSDIPSDARCVAVMTSFEPIPSVSTARPILHQILLGRRWAWRLVICGSWLGGGGSSTKP